MRLQFSIRFLIQGLVPFGMMVVSFAFSNRTTDPFHALRWTLLSLVGALGWALYSGREGDFRARRLDAESGGISPFIPAFPNLSISSLGAVLAGGYLAASILSLLAAKNRSEALWQIVQASIWCGWFLLVRRAGVQDESLWPRIRAAAVTCALLGSGYAIGQYWGIWNGRESLGQGPGGLSGNRNLLASMQFLLLPWMLWALLTEKGIMRVFAAAAWVGFCYVLAITQCRGVWLGFLAASLSALGIWRFSFGSRSALLAAVRQTMAAFLIAVLVGAFTLHGLAKPAWDIRGGGLQRAASMVDPGFDSNAQRLALWKKTVHLIVGHPLVGVGAGNWKIALPSVGMQGLIWPDMSVTEVRPYNDWLWTLSETGLAGGLCWLGLWLTGLIAGMRAVRNPASPGLRLPSLLLTAGMLGFGIISALDYPRERPEHMAWYAVSLAALFSMGRPGKGLPLTWRPVWTVRRYAGAGAVLLLIGASVFSAFRWQNEGVVQQVMIAHARGDWREVADLVPRIDERFCTLNPAASPMAWHQGIALYQMGDGTGAEAAFRHALDVHPWHILTLHNLAVCRLNARDTAAAMTYLDASLAIAPGFQAGVFAVSRLRMLQGKFGTAREALAGIEPQERGHEWHLLDETIAMHERKNL